MRGLPSIRGGASMGGTHYQTNSTFFGRTFYGNQSASIISFGDLVDVIDRNSEGKQKAALMQAELMQGLKLYNELIVLVAAKEKQLYFLEEALRNTEPFDRTSSNFLKRSKLRSELVLALASIEKEEFQHKVLTNMKGARADDLVCIKKPIIERLNMMPYVSQIIDKEGKLIWGKLKDVEEIELNIMRMDPLNQSAHDQSKEKTYLGFPTHFEGDLIKEDSRRTPPPPDQREKLEALLKTERDYLDRVKGKKLQVLQDRRRSIELAEVERHRYYIEQTAFYEEKRSGLLEQIGRLQKNLGNETDPKDVVQYILDAKYPCRHSHQSLGISLSSWSRKSMTY
jgi:hypothetical protein